MESLFTFTVSFALHTLAIRIIIRKRKEREESKEMCYTAQFSSTTVLDGKGIYSLNLIRWREHGPARYVVFLRWQKTNGSKAREEFSILYSCSLSMVHIYFYIVHAYFYAMQLLWLMLVLRKIGPVWFCEVICRIRVVKRLLERARSGERKTTVWKVKHQNHVSSYDLAAPN